MGLGSWCPLEEPDATHLHVFQTASLPVVVEPLHLPLEAVVLPILEATVRDDVP